MGKKCEKTNLVSWVNDIRLSGWDCSLDVSNVWGFQPTDQFMALAFCKKFWWILHLSMNKLRKPRFETLDRRRKEKIFDNMWRLWFMTIVIVTLEFVGTSCLPPSAFSFDCADHQPSRKQRPRGVGDVWWTYVIQRKDSQRNDPVLMLFFRYIMCVCKKMDPVYSVYSLVFCL